MNRRRWWSCQPTPLAAVARSGCGSHAAFAAYVEGELLATGQVEESVLFYVGAIDEAHRVGANFVYGFAGVALASARTRIGDVAGAAEGFAYLIDNWRRAGQSTPAVDHSAQTPRDCCRRWAVREPPRCC